MRAAPEHLDRGQLSAPATRRRLATPLEVQLIDWKIWAGKTLLGDLWGPQPELGPDLGSNLEPTKSMQKCTKKNSPIRIKESIFVPKFELGSPISTHP